MKVSIANSRTDLAIEGDVIEVMLDLADLKLSTMEGRKIIDEVQKTQNDKFIPKSDYAIESGIEVGFILRPLSLDLILVMFMHDNGEYTVKCYSDTNSKPYINLYNYCNGAK